MGVTRGVNYRGFLVVRIKMKHRSLSGILVAFLRSLPQQAGGVESGGIPEGWRVKSLEEMVMRGGSG